MTAEFSIEPCSIGALLWKPAVPFLIPAIGVQVASTYIRGGWEFGDPFWVGVMLSLMGFVRSVWWAFMYRKNAFYMDRDGVTLTSLSKERNIPLDEVYGIRFLEPIRGPEFRHGGFQVVELELANNKKMKHKVAIFKKECIEKSKDLDSVAPTFGFTEGERKFSDTGFLRK